MKKVPVSKSVAEATEHLKKSVVEKGFVVFADIDHQANASSVDLEMPAARVLLFGNPAAGTKLMQKDITVGFDLPLRVAIVDDNGQTTVVFLSSEHLGEFYDLAGHPVLEKIETLFGTLVSELQ